MAQCTAQESQVDGDQSHVSKIETELQRTVHLGLEYVIVDTVQEYVCRRGRTRSKGSPLPEVVFCVQTKVNNNDRCHTDHNGQNGIDTE